MSYQPNYCNNCGEKVVRDDWKFWTSTRFCENCEIEKRHIEWIPKITFALTALIGGLFGFGSYLKTPEKPLALMNNQITASAANKSQNVQSQQPSVNTTVQNPAVKSTNQTNVGLPDQTKAAVSQKTSARPMQLENTQIVESEPVYFCGAQTKKGTPCTRKVKGAGRCWQHTGLPAMLPKEKLVSSP